MHIMNHKIGKSFQELFNSIYLYHSHKFNYKEIVITNAYRLGFDKKRDIATICIEINHQDILGTPLCFGDARYILKFFKYERKD